MARLEGNLQDKVLRDLRSYGKYISVFKIVRTSDNGIPDVYFTTALTGSVFVELKKPGAKPREDQVHKINELNRCGARAYACDSWTRWVEIKHEINLTKESVII